MWWASRMVYRICYQGRTLVIQSWFIHNWAIMGLQGMMKWWVLGHIILSAAQIQEPKNHRKMSVVTSAARNSREKTRSIWPHCRQCHSYNHLWWIRFRMRGKLRSYDISIHTIRDSQKISISEDVRIEGKTILSVTSCVCPIQAW